MSDLISKATNEVFKPAFGGRSDVESRIAIRLLLLYFCEKGVIDGGDYRSFVESVGDNVSKMIESENHPIPMNSNNQEEKDKLKNDIRRNLMSFAGHLPINTKPSGYMLDGVPIEDVMQDSDDKRPPIKEQTLDEFNNAQQVAYGSNLQVEPLTSDDADLSHEAWLDFKVKNRPQAERTVKWLIKEYDIKLD